MYRYFIHLSYKGTHYHGWQVQPNALTVQEELEKALSIVLNKKTAIVGAGRTDTGVHASCMVAHFDSDKKIVNDKFIFRINSILSRFISIFSLSEVKPEFHARFDALSRTYNYKLTTNKDPFLYDYTYKVNRELNFSLMNEAAALLIGKKDFSCFSKSNTQTFTNDCELMKAEWFQKETGVWVFEIKANRFLRNMVRAIVGTLIEVGEGKRNVESITELIKNKSRSKSGASVPAKGLFLVNIEYPKEGFIG